MEKKRLIIFGVIILVVLLSGAYAFYRVTKKDVEEIVIGVNAREVLLNCSTDLSLKALYYSPNETGVMTKLKLSVTDANGTIEYPMLQTLSASGAKFETEDKVFSLWEHQKTFSFDQHGRSVALCEEGVVDKFLLDDQMVALVNDIYEKEVVPGSVTREIVRYFGNEARGDINGDGKDDRVFLITKETSGSGVFFYLVGQLATENGEKGTQAVFVGDRIAPQTTQVENGEVLVNYADRKVGEPMTAAPTVGKTLILKYNKDFNEFGEAVQDFEGEADIAKMNLSMTEWKWQKTVYKDNKEVFPKNKDAFVATFTKAGDATFRTDCNTLNASFETGTGTITFGPMMSTKMFCEGSQEVEYSEMLSKVEKYIFTSRGELILLTENGGSMIFR